MGDGHPDTAHTRVLCPRCEYDLSGLEASDCPECGLPRLRILASQVRAFGPARLRSQTVATLFAGETALVFAVGVYAIMFLKVANRLGVRSDVSIHPSPILAIYFIASLYALPACFLSVSRLTIPRPREFADDPQGLRRRARVCTVLGITLYMLGLWGVQILLGVVRARTLFGLSRYGLTFALAEPSFMLLGVAAFQHGAAIACQHVALRASEPHLARRAARLSTWLPAITVFGAATLGPIVSGVLLTRLMRQLRPHLRPR